MAYNPDKHHRRSIRLRGYDYTARGAYFITICVHGRACLLGNVTGEEMRLNIYGSTVTECWHTIPDHFPDIELDAFVAMPNHVHGIISITSDAAGSREARRSANGSCSNSAVILRS